MKNLLFLLAGSLLLAGFKLRAADNTNAISVAVATAPDSNPEHPPINWVKAHYDSIHGRIASRWRRTRDRFQLEVEIPANTTATVYLPASSADNITESGRPLAKVEGIRLLRVEDGRFVIAVESGSYSFATH